MTVAVAVARADDAGPRWQRRRHGGWHGGRAGLGGAGGPAAEAPAAGGRGGGDGRGFQGRAPRGGGHQGPAARGGAARGGAAGGGAEEVVAPPARGGRPRGGHGRGGGEDDAGAARAEGNPGGADPARGGGGGGGNGGDAPANRHGAPLELRKDAIDWQEGNPNTNEGYSGGTHGMESPAAANDEVIQNPNPVIVRPRPRPEFVPFSELGIFDNPHPNQAPHINQLNADLVVVFESIHVLRGNIYTLMCQVPTANDPESLGKQIRGEIKKANQLLKNAEDDVKTIEDRDGLPVPVPPQFYTVVKPTRE